MHKQRGVALVEFAIAVPLLALILVGLIEVGRYAYFAIAVGNAARAGASFGAASFVNAANLAGIRAAATTDGTNNVHAITPTAQTVCSCWNGATGTESPAPPTHATCGTTCATGVNVTYVQVDTTGTFTSMFNYPMLPNSYTASARAIMRVKQ